MPTRFLNNININDSYTMPAADGTADQIISTDGAGQLSFIDQTTLSAESAEVVKVPVKNLQGSALTKGDPVYISGSVGTSGRLEVKLADAGDTTKMPALGLLEQDLVINGEGYAVVTGKLRNLVTSPIDGATPSEGDVVYVKSNGTTGAALTTTKPIGVNLIQNMGKVGRASTSNDGTFIVSSILRSNDVPTPIYIDHAFQKVGIGETSPDEILHIKGPTPKIKLEHSSGYFESKVEFYSTTGKAGELAAYNNPGFQGVILSYDMGTPTTRFQVETNKFRLITSDPANYQAEVFIDEYIVHEGDPDTKFGFVANDNFAITTGGVERVRVTSGGSVGIATNNPGAKLDVEGNAVIGAAGNTVSGAFGVAINKNTVVTSEDGFAQGENTIATGRQGAAFGFNTYANGAASIAGGALSETNAQRSIAVGATAITNAEDSAAFNAGTRANGLFSFATGQGCFATGNASFATGSNTQATALYSFSGGVNSIASAPGAVALGGGAQCSGEFSFAAGNINVASGINSTALGFDNDAIGAHSTVIGHLNTTSAAAAYGVAINFQNTVSGQAAFAFNQGNTVSGLNAAAGGVSNTVDAEGSFAYGFGNDTAGAGATPPQQILLGRFLKPPRDVAGNAGEAQVIVGRHNEHANQSATAFAVGTGTAANATRSSLKVYYDNTVTLADNVTVNSSYSYFNQPIRIGANAAVNELDDYEEGSYNVQFFVSGFGNYGSSNWVSGGGTVWTDNSQYVKVGRKVTLFFDLEYKGIPTSIATTSATFYLTNLPFTMTHGGGGNISFSWYNRNASSNANPQDLGGATRLTGQNNQSPLLKLEHLEYSSYWNAWNADTMQTNYLPTTPPGGNIQMRGQFTYFTNN